MYCPSCGTQNDDAHKFCKKCGTALPSRQAQQSRATPSQPAQSAPKTIEKPTVKLVDRAASALTLGGIAGMLGGALVVIGWFLPWAKDFLTTTSGFNLAISGVTSIFAGFGLLFDDFGGLGFLLLLYGIVSAIAYGIIPIWGWMNTKDGYQVFEKRNLPKDIAERTLTMAEFRSRRGFILVAVIFLLPLAFSAVLKSASPLLYYLGQLAGKLIQSETGPGIFVTGAGFALSYVGTRYAGVQIGQIILEEARNFRASIQPKSKVEVLPPLNETEIAIVNGLIQSQDEAAIAGRLNIPESTLSMMLLNLYHRYNVKTKEELISLLVSENFIS